MEEKFWCVGKYAKRKKDRKIKVMFSSGLAGSYTEAIDYADKHNLECWGQRVKLY